MKIAQHAGVSEAAVRAAIEQQALNGSLRTRVTPGHWMVREDEVERWGATLSAPERFPEPEG